MKLEMGTDRDIRRVRDTFQMRRPEKQRELEKTMEC